MRLLDFWLIKIDHLSSKRLVSRGFFSKKPCFKWTLPQKTTINKGTPNSFYINSSSIETLSKSHQAAEELQDLQSRNSIRFKPQNSKWILHQNLQIKKNTWTRFIQIIFFQTSKLYWNRAPQSPKNSITLIHGRFVRSIQAQKPWRTSTHKSSNSENTKRFKEHSKNLWRTRIMKNF